MKLKVSLLCAMTVASLPVAGWADDGATNPPDAPPPPSTVATDAATSVPALPPTPVAPAAATAVPSPAAAPAALPMPAMSPPAREIVKLAGTGVPDEVIKAYIENSGSTFNLTTDGVIYLQNAHVSGSITSAMLLHDKSIREQSAAMANLPPAPSPYAYPPPPMPPQMDDASQPQVDVTYIPNRDYNPYGGWQYANDFGWYWQPYTWTGYPWGLVGLNTGRWWNHPRYGLVWSHGSQFRHRTGAPNQAVVIGRPAQVPRPGVQNFTTGRIQFTTGSLHH